MCVHFYQNPNLSEISTFKIIFRIFKKIYQVWSALLSILNIYVGVSDTESYIRLKKWIIEMGRGCKNFASLHLLTHHNTTSKWKCIWGWAHLNVISSPRRAMRWDDVISYYSAWPHLISSHPPWRRAMR